MIQMILLIIICDCKQILSITNECVTYLDLLPFRSNLKAVNQFLIKHIDNNQHAIQSCKSNVRPIDAKCTYYIFKILMIFNVFLLMEIINFLKAASIIHLIHMIFLSRIIFELIINYTLSNYSLFIFSPVHNELIVLISNDSKVIGYITFFIFRLSLNV